MKNQKHKNRLPEILAKSIFVILATIIILFILFFILSLVYLKFFDPESTDYSNLGYARTAGNKIGEYYLKNNKLPQNLSEIGVSEIHKPKLAKNKYRLKYTIVGEKDFKLVSIGDESIAYFYPGWNTFNNNIFGCCFGMSNYKIDEFFSTKQPPYDSPEVWP